MPIGMPANVDLVETMLTGSGVAEMVEDRARILSLYLLISVKAAMLHCRQFMETIVMPHMLRMVVNMRTLLNMLAVKVNFRIL